MFGLLRPYHKKMLKHEKQEYKQYYCGLCMGMGRNTGLLSRFLINFDVCLAYLVADSIDCKSQTKCKRCPFSPINKITYKDNTELLDKLSKINYVLSYHKVLDDIYDDNNLKSKIVELMMRRKYNKIKITNEEVVLSVSDGMNLIREFEANHKTKLGIEDAARPFGDLLSNVMSDCIEDPIDSEAFMILCKHLGMWIYVVDACFDLRKDIRNNKYNPLKIGYDNLSADEIIKLRKLEIIDFLLKCKQSMFQLLKLLSFESNDELINLLFTYILPQEVADMLE